MTSQRERRVAALKRMARREETLSRIDQQAMRVHKAFTQEGKTWTAQRLRRVAETLRGFRTHAAQEYTATSQYLKAAMRNDLRSDRYVAHMEDAATLTATLDALISTAEVSLPGTAKRHK